MKRIPPRTSLKIIMLFLFLAVISAFFAFDLERYLSLEAIKNNCEMLQSYYRVHPIETLLYFGLSDLAIATFSIPVSALMTILAGAIFGFWPALVVVAIATNFGATLIFLAARFLFYDVVERKFGARFPAINAGIRRDGWVYLFAIRLTPFFPFWMVNLLAALTPIRTWTFFWVTLLGSMPARVLYILAGIELDKIESTEDILSPMLLTLFTLLGLLPLIAKKSMTWLQERKT